MISSQNYLPTIKARINPGPARGTFVASVGERRSPWRSGSKITAYSPRASPRPAQPLTERARELTVPGASAGRSSRTAAKA